MTNQLCDNGTGYKTKIAMVICPLAFSAIMAFAGLGDGIIGNHEAFVGVTAREMLNSGDWIVPEYNGQARLNKTPLCYWLVAAAGKLAGRVDDFVVRLPSALLAVLSAGAILFFVNKWLGLRIAALAVVFWSTSLGFIRYSHSGRPEMALCVFVTIAMLSFYTGMIAPSRKEQIWYMLVFWISFSLGMLAKGPAPILLIGPAVFFYFAVFRKWKSIGKTLPIIGTLLFLIMILPWPIMVFLKEPEVLHIWKSQFIDRATGDLSSNDKPIYYYLGVMFAFFVPWVAFLPLSLAAPFFRIWGKKQNTMLFLWLWFVADIVAMSLCSGKRQHYIFPAMPATAILTAIIFEDMMFVKQAYTEKFSKNFFSGHLIALLSLAVVGAIWIATGGGEFQLPIIALMTLSVLMLMIITFLLRHNAKIAACICIFATVAIVSILGLIKISNQQNEKYMSRDFAEEVKKMVGQNEKLIAYCKVKSAFVYYFEREVPEIFDLERVHTFYDEGGSVLAIRGYLDKLKSDGRFEIEYSYPYDEAAIFNKNVGN